MQTIGIDTGGTFTDLVRIGDDGSVTIHKAPSTPVDYAQGVLDVMAMAGDTEGEAADFHARLSSLTLGTTIATNTFLTRSGAKVGLISTIGHGDTLELMRVVGRVAGLSSTETQSYAMTDKPRPVVARRLVEEVTERIDFRGEVVVPLNEGEVVAALGRLVTSGVEVVAVALLWSFLNARHEHRVRELAVERFPELRLVLSSDVVPKLGEYERTVTTVIDAYVSPVITRYLDRVSGGLSQQGLSLPILVMHSSGGVGTERYTRDHPILTLFSGPAGGVIGAQRVGERMGHENIVCTDMGGTSFDVGLVVKGRPQLRTTTIIDKNVMYLPSVDIVSIGAGGGSIVGVVDGSLRIGPESAGADPGPACYGRGGENPTLTDADVILGYIDPDRFLGGRVKLDRDRAEAAFAERVGEPLGLETAAAAASVFAVANARMADMVRKATVDRGFDPRDFTLYAYGGLGPLHAPFYSTDLEVKSVVVPLGEISSVFSAYGIAVSDLVHVFELSCPMFAPFNPDVINENFTRLERSAWVRLDEDGVPENDRVLHRFVEMRYKGQSSEIAVPVGRERLGAAEAERLENDFETRYVSAFGPGSSWNEAAKELVALRVEAVGQRRIPVRAEDVARLPFTAIEQRQRSVFWPSEDGYLPTPVLDGLGLAPGVAVEGPAVLDLTTTTALVPPNWVCEADAAGNLALRATSPGGRRA